MNNFTKTEIETVNSTCRNNGASAINSDGTIRAIVPKYISEHINKFMSILDYGAGKMAIHSQWLKTQGFTNVTSYDIGDNCVAGIHDKNALSKQYHVIFASNVLNTIPTSDMLKTTLLQMYDSLEEGGLLICNYPSSPRKFQIATSEMTKFIQSTLHCEIRVVGGSKSAPIWRIVKNTKITKEKIEQYLTSHGYPNPDKNFVEMFIANGSWQDQYDECINRQLDIADFDRWQWLQKIMGVKMTYETAMKIDSALWEEEIETLELPCESKTMWNTDSNI